MAMRLVFLILFAAAVVSGCSTPIVAIEKESCLTCPEGTIITKPDGSEYTVKEGMYLRKDIVNLALDAKMKRK
jgi:hypothetical protein